VLLKGEQFFEPGFDIHVNREMESFTLSPHIHDFIELCFVEEGSGYHYVDDKVIPIKRGDLFVIPIGTSHVFRPSSPKQDKPLVIYNCIFRPSVLAEWKHMFSSNSKVMKLLFGSPRVTIKDIHFQDRNDQFSTLFYNMHTEYLRKHTGYKTILTTLLIQILSMLQRYEVQPTTEDTPANKLEDALEYIKNNYAQNITVKQMADLSYMSASHFQRLFKKSTGLTFTQYLQNVRIQKCCELLKTTNKSVNQIANLVGYQDMKFFHYLFRKKTGVTPQQYRHSKQENKAVNV